MRSSIFQNIGDVLGNGYAIYVNDPHTEHLIDVGIGSWNFKAFEYTVDTRVALQFDVIEETNFRGSSTVTSYPREDGVMVTDYKYQNPGVLQVNGILTRKSAVGNLLSLALSGSTNIRKMVESLEHYKRGMYALNIQTKTALYQNYTLESYEIPEDYDSYGVLNVSMTFKQLFKTSETQNTLPNLMNTVKSGLCRVLGLN